MAASGHPTLALPRVILSGPAAALAGGRTEIEVEATSFGRLVRELEARFPGLGNQVEHGMAVAIDGTIWQDAYAAPLREASEIVLIPRIGGG